jgi:hypothetical protein
MRLLGREGWVGLVAGRGAGEQGMGQGWEGMALDHGHGPQAHQRRRRDYAGKDTNCCTTDQTNALSLHSAPGQVMAHDGP